MLKCKEYSLPTRTEKGVVEWVATILWDPDSVRLCTFTKNYTKVKRKGNLFTPTYRKV